MLMGSQPLDFPKATAHDFLRFEKMRGKGARVVLKSSMSMAGLCSGAESAVGEAAGDVIRDQKRRLRTAVRRRLREFDASQQQIEDSAIQRHILEADWFKKSRRLCAYISCPSLREVETSKIIDHILKQDTNAVQSQKLYVPRIKDKQSHMQMLHVESYNDLVPNSMSILEPTLQDLSGKPREDVMGTEEAVDLLLLPGLAFDLSGRRLGRGGGYYDCFLSSLLKLNESKGWKRPLLVALAYTPQIVDEPVPVDETDVPVDALVTAKGAILISDHAHSQMS